MKRVSLIMLISVLLLSGCAKYTEKDLERAYNEGLSEGIMQSEQEWWAGYERGYTDYLKEDGSSYSGNTATEYIYTGDEEVKWDACERLDDVYSSLSRIQTYIENEQYDEAKQEAEDAKWELDKALQMLDFYA